MAQIPTTTQHQLNILKGRGLVIDVPECEVESFLQRNNYYRFRGYLINFYVKDPSSGDDIFNGTTKFSEIRSAYDCDASLRRAIRDVLEVNEIYLRTIYVLFFSNYLGNAYFFYSDNIFRFNDIRESKIQNVRSNIKKLVSKHSHSLIIKRYTDPISQICKLPSWAYIEFMSFGDVSMIYEATESNYIKFLNQSHFKFPNQMSHQFLLSWTRSLAKFRNVCHHYERLYYVNLQETPPKIFTNSRFDSIYKMTLQNITKPFSYIVISVSLCPDADMVKNLIHAIKELIKTYPSIDFEQAYGFPTNWELILNSLNGYFLQ